MFSGLKNKAASVVRSFDPVEQLKYLSKHTTDDPSTLNQNLRDVCRHLGTPLHDRADQTIGCMLANHASRMLATLWTVLLQGLRESDDLRAQLCILTHFGRIANRIAIPQRGNAFRVFAKEIVALCGSQDVVGDRQFATACNATLAALGTHADGLLARALLEKLLQGMFSWTRSDARRAASSVCATLIFRTTGCDGFVATLEGVVAAGRPLQGIVMLIDTALPLLLEQAAALCPFSPLGAYYTVAHVSVFVAVRLREMLEGEAAAIDPIALPSLASCFTRLRAVPDAPPTSTCEDAAIRAHVVRHLTARERGVKKILWCPLLSLLHVTDLPEDPAALQAELALLRELSDCPDSMARSEALIAITLLMPRIADADVAAMVDAALDSHRRYCAERCHLSIRGLLRLLAVCFPRLPRVTGADVLHVLLRAHMDLGNTLNTMPVVQLEVLAVVEHTVVHLSAEGLAYVLMCLQKGDAKVRERAAGVLMRLCREASMDDMQLLEPALRGVDLIEGAVAEPARPVSDCPRPLSPSPLHRQAANFRAVLAFLTHQLAAEMYDTPKDEAAAVQTLSEVLALAVRESQDLAALFTELDADTTPADSATTAAAAVSAAPQLASPSAAPQLASPSAAAVDDANPNDATLSPRAGPTAARVTQSVPAVRRRAGAPLEHHVLHAAVVLADIVTGATSLPVDAVCAVVDALGTCAAALAESTQFDIHFHKRLTSFAWNVLARCAAAIDPVAAPKLAEDPSLYFGCVPLHPNTVAMIAASAASAMSTSEYGATTAFFALTTATLRLLRALMRWGHCSRVFVTHLRVQYAVFCGVMDVLVSTRPVQVLECTDTMLRTALTVRCDDGGVVLPPSHNMDAYGRLVAACVPVMNRSLSFDLVAVGRTLFALVRLLADIDTAAGWTACYGALDKGGQLFLRMLEILTDASYYNAVSGPAVIAHITAAVVALRNSPHLERLTALMRATEEGEDGAGGAESSGCDSPRGDVFNGTLAVIRAHIAEAHATHRCSVFADAAHMLDAPTAHLREAGKGASRAAHDTGLAWLRGCGAPDALCAFAKTIPVALAAVCAAIVEGGHDTAADGEYILRCARALRGKVDPLVAAECVAVAAQALEAGMGTLLGGLVASVLDPSAHLVPTLERVLSAAFDGQEGGTPFAVRPEDVSVLVAVLEQPSCTVALEGRVVRFSRHPGEHSAAATAPPTVAAATAVMALLPPTATIALPDDDPAPVAAFLADPAWGPARLSFVVVACRSAIVLPSAQVLCDVAFLQTIMDLYETHPARMAGAQDLPWAVFGAAARAALGPHPLLADASLLAAIIADVCMQPDPEDIRAFLGGLVGDDPTDDADGAVEYLAAVLLLPAEGAVQDDDAFYDEQQSPPAAVTLEDIVRSVPFCGRWLLAAADVGALEVDDLVEAAAAVRTPSDGARLARMLTAICVRAPAAVTSRALIATVTALVASEVTIEAFASTPAETAALLDVLGRLLEHHRRGFDGGDEGLAVRYAAMFLLVLASPNGDGRWQAIAEGTGTDAAWAALKQPVLRILAAVLELPDGTDIGAIARFVLSIFTQSQRLAVGINESVLWLVVRCCPAAVWQAVSGGEVCGGDSTLPVLRFIVSMNQTVGIGPELLMELHARYTPLLLAFGTARDMDTDEQRLSLWLITSMLLHIIVSEERHTKTKPHMGLADALPLYVDFPLTQMCARTVGDIRAHVDEHLYPRVFRMSIAPAERHWNIHTRGHLLPVLGRRPLARGEADKLCSSMLHMYLHVVTSVLSNVGKHAPETIADVFGSLSVLAAGNAPLLKHSPTTDGTVAAAILALLYQWYGKYAAASVLAVEKGATAVRFGGGLFPLPVASLDFCDTYMILACATAVSSLFVRGNERIPGAVDVSFVLDRMMGADLVSHQAALAAVVVMSSSSTRRELSCVAPLLTQRVLRELDGCMRGSLSFSFGVMQMLRTAFSILSAFPDDAVTMKVCEAVWNVVVNEGGGGRRIQHYAHFVLQAIISMHTVSETQWHILRAIVCLPQAEAARIVSEGRRLAEGRGGNGGPDMSSAASFVQDSARFVESGRQFFADRLQQLATATTGTGTGGRSGGANIPPAVTLLRPRSTILTSTALRRALLSVAEAEDVSQRGAALVYGTTANLLRLTTVSAMVLRSSSGGEGGEDEADRNRVMVLDMLRQVEDASSRTADTFLRVVLALVRAVVGGEEAIFMVLNRFSLTPSPMFMFATQLAASVDQPPPGGPLPSAALGLHVEAAARLPLDGIGGLWVLANLLAAAARWEARRATSGAATVSSGTALRGALPVGVLHSRVLLQGLCGALWRAVEGTAAAELIIAAIRALPSAAPLARLCSAVQRQTTIETET